VLNAPPLPPAVGGTLRRQRPPNPEEDKDLILFRKLGLNPEHTGTTAGDNEQQQG
jgi:hypothetical protein